MLPRAIRVGPHAGDKQLGLNTGGLSVFFSSIPGVYLYFSPPYRGFIKDKPGLSQIARRARKR